MQTMMESIDNKYKTGWNGKIGLIIHPIWVQRLDAHSWIVLVKPGRQKKENRHILILHLNLTAFHDDR